MSRRPSDAAWVAGAAAAVAIAAAGVSAYFAARRSPADTIGPQQPVTPPAPPQRPQEAFGWVGAGVALPVALVIAWAIIASIPPPPAGPPESHAAAISYVVRTASAWITVVFGLIAFTGTVMQLGAHFSDNNQWLDFGGKFAVAVAGALAFWVGVLSLPYTLDWNVNSFVTACLGGLLICSGTLLYRWDRRRRRFP